MQGDCWTRSADQSQCQSHARDGAPATQTSVGSISLIVIEKLPSGGKAYSSQLIRRLLSNSGSCLWECLYIAVLMITCMAMISFSPIHVCPSIDTNTICGSYTVVKKHMAMYHSDPDIVGIGACSPDVRRKITRFKYSGERITYVNITTHR